MNAFECSSKLEDNKDLSWGPKSILYFINAIIINKYKVNSKIHQ